MTNDEWVINEAKERMRYMVKEGYPGVVSTLGDALEMLKRNIPQERELEGGGSTWWYVCPECHGAIDSLDKFCRHCGQAVKA